MKLIQQLRNDFPDSFPLISKSKLEKLILRSSRFQSLCPSEVTAEAVNFLIVYKRLAEEMSAELVNVAALILNCSQIDDLVKLNAWIEYLDISLLYEDKTLPFLFHLEMAEAISFAGNIYYLLSKGIAAEEIVRTGILHWFFNMQSYQMDEVIKVYELLSALDNSTLPFRAELVALMRMVKEVAGSEDEVFRFYALNGHHYDEPLIPIEVRKPPFEYTPSLNNLRNLHTYFGDTFLIKILHDDSWHYDESLKTSLKEFFGLLSIPEVERIFVTNEEIGPELRMKLFSTIGFFLEYSQIKDLLTKRKFEWLILAMQPKLVDEVSLSFIEEIVNYDFIPQQINAIIAVSNHAQFYPYLSKIYRKLFDMILETPSLLTEALEPFASELRKRIETKHWCVLAADKMKAKLEAIIKEGVQTFTHSNYVDIWTFYWQQRSKLEVLNKLSAYKLNYPQSKYELYALIISVFYEESIKPWIKDLGDDVSAIVPAMAPLFLDVLSVLYTTEAQNYSEREIRKAKCRTLYECLIYINDNQFISYIIGVLIHSFQEIEWKKAIIDNAQLVDKALINGNQALLEYYFKTSMSNDEKLKLFKQINLRQSVHLLQQIKNNPVALQVCKNLFDINTFLSIVEQPLNPERSTLLHLVAANEPALFVDILNLFPENLRWLALKRKNHKENTVLHMASTEAVVQAILKEYPENYRKGAIDELNADGNSVMHYQAHNFEVLQCLLNIYPSEEVPVVIDQVNAVGDNLIHLSVKNPSCLHLLLKILPERKRLEALKILNGTNTPLLHLLVRRYELVRIVFDFFPDIPTRRNLLQIENAHHETFLEAALDNDDAEVLNFIFSLYLDDELQALLDGKDDAGNTLLHRAVQKPMILRTFLGKYPIERRFAALTEPNNEGVMPLELAINHAYILRIIIDMLTPIQRLNLLQMKYAGGNNILHRAAGTFDNFKSSMNLCIEFQCLNLLNERNDNGDTVLHTIAECGNLRVIKLVLPIFNIQLNRALQQKNRQGNTPLHLLETEPAILKIVLEAVLEHHRFALLQQVNNENKLLLSFVKNNLKTLQVIFDAISVNDCLETLQINDEDGDQWIYKFAKHIPTLKYILERIPLELLLSIFDVPNRIGNTVYFQICSEAKLLKQILEKHPHPRAVIETCNKEGNNLLHIAAFYYPDTFQMLLTFYKSEEIAAKIEVVNCEHKSILQLATLKAISLLHILRKLPDEQRYAKLQTLDHTMSVLHRVASNSEGFQEIFAIYPQERRQEALQKRNERGKTVLHSYYSNHPELTPSILEMIPEAKRLQVLSQKDYEDNSVLYLSRHKPMVLIALLEKLTLRQRYEALLIQNANHRTLMDFLEENDDINRRVQVLLIEPEREPTRSFFTFFSVGNNTMETDDDDFELSFSG